MNTKNKDKPFRCPHETCEAKFSRAYRLTDHLYSAHANIKVYVCQEVQGCNKSYSNKSHLIRHINKSHKQIKNDVLYSCPTCCKTYVNRQNLKRHVNLHHNNKDNFYCDVCKKCFKKKNQLRAHMYEHTGIKSFCCNLCEKEFVTLFERKKHIRYHKTYECTECKVKFDLWSSFQKHKKLVHQVKEFICNDCNRTFKKRSHIVRHVKIHLGLRNASVYKCPYENCERFYTRNNNLKQHIMAKHVKLTHECAICKAQLSTKGALTVHLKRHTDRPKELKPPKTKATGRKERKDKGTIKGSSAALKLVGLPAQHEELTLMTSSPLKIEVEIDLNNELTSDDDKTSGFTSMPCDNSSYLVKIEKDET